MVVTAEGVLFLNENRGAVDVLLVPFDGGEPTVLMDGRRQVQAVDAATTSAGLLLMATVADGQTWGDVVVRQTDGTERVLTDWSADYRAEVPVRPLTEVTATAPDGYPVHGWLVRPDGDGPHPLLLMIHGGPFTQYGWQLFDEAQVYAGAGYAVLYTNPRGSSGYGQAHGRAVIGNVGEVSTVDLMAILDATLAANPDLDGSRIGRARRIARRLHDDVARRRTRGTGSRRRSPSERSTRSTASPVRRTSAGSSATTSTAPTSRSSSGSRR